jgi:hypothetical protein
VFQRSWGTPGGNGGAGATFHIPQSFPFTSLWRKPAESAGPILPLGAVYFATSPRQNFANSFWWHVGEADWQGDSDLYSSPDVPLPPPAGPSTL